MHYITIYAPNPFTNDNKSDYVTNTNVQFSCRPSRMCVPLQQSVFVMLDESFCIVPGSLPKSRVYGVCANICAYNSSTNRYAFFSTNDTAECQPNIYANKFTDYGSQHHYHCNYWYNYNYIRDDIYTNNENFYTNEFNTHIYINIY